MRINASLFLMPPLGPLESKTSAPGLTFSGSVRLSLGHILSQVQWWSVFMVTRYDVAGGQAILSENKCFSDFFQR